MSIGLGGASSSRHRPGQVLADSAPRAKVVQTVVCSTFTRGAKPATRRVADGERMNPREGWRVRANTEDDEHQGDKHLENSRALRAAAPDPASMGSPPLVLYHPASYADAAGSSLHQRGGTPHPEFYPSGRARRVPDRVVRQEASRSLADSLSPDPTWNAAHRQVPNQT